MQSQLKCGSDALPLEAVHPARRSPGFNDEAHIHQPTKTEISPESGTARWSHWSFNKFSESIFRSQSAINHHSWVDRNELNWKRTWANHRRSAGWLCQM